MRCSALHSDGPTLESRAGWDGAGDRGARAGRTSDSELSSAMAAAAVLLLCGAQLAAGADCPADGTGTTHSNSVYVESANAGTATSGPKLPDISSRPMRSYGAVGSCSGSADDGSFDGGEIVVAATIPLHGPQSSKSYARIMRYTAELFLDWVNLEKGGLMVGGERYSMRFVWTDDKQQANDAALAIVHSIRREGAHFGWGGYGSTMSRLQAEQAALDGVLFMASIAAAPGVFEDRPLTFGALPPDYTCKMVMLSRFDRLSDLSEKHHYCRHPKRGARGGGRSDGLGGNTRGQRPAGRAGVHVAPRRHVRASRAAGSQSRDDSRGRKIVILSRFVTLSIFNPKSVTISVFEKQSSFYFQAKSHANLIKDNIFVRPFFPLPHFARR